MSSEEEVGWINFSGFTAERPRSSASSSGLLVVYRVLKAEERAEDEVSGRRRSRGSWGEQEEQRREEREGMRGRRMARWARWATSELVTKVTSAWEGERRRLEARESLSCHSDARDLKFDSYATSKRTLKNDDLFSNHKVYNLAGPGSFSCRQGICSLNSRTE